MADDTSVLAPVDGNPFGEPATAGLTDQSTLQNAWNDISDRYHDVLRNFSTAPSGSSMIGSMADLARRDLTQKYHNFIAGPLEEASKFGEDPQASAAASPVAQAFDTIARGGTGDPEQDAEARNRAVGYALDAAKWVAVPGLGRAALAPAEEASLGSFGGRIAAKNFPGAEDALTKAQSYEAMGVPNNDIHQLTGWRKGKEGIWEFEIPDKGAVSRPYDPAVHGANANGLPKYFRPSDIIDHPLLEQAYPEIMHSDDVHVFFDPKLEGQDAAHATTDPSTGQAVIGIAKPVGILPGQGLPRATISNLLHEINHVIGEKVEGRSAGGSPRIVARKVGDVLHDQGYDDSEINRAVWAYYKSLADETRGRVVQTRYMMHPDDLIREPYYRTAARMGYPEENQIIPPPANGEPERASIIAQMKQYGLLADRPVAKAMAERLRQPVGPKTPDNLRSTIHSP